MAGFICVGLGGAAGAMLRYAVSLIPYKGTFPLLTLLINFLGALVIGFIAGTAIRRELDPNFVLFLKTGVCGGFTTFSTFSLETMTLLEQGKVNHAIFYTILSVVLCLIGIFIGKNIF